MEQSTLGVIPRPKIHLHPSTRYAAQILSSFLHKNARFPIPYVINVYHLFLESNTCKVEH